MESQSKSSWMSSGGRARRIWKAWDGITCCWFKAPWWPAIVVPGVLSACGMWGYPGVGITEGGRFCLESMYRFPVPMCWEGFVGCMAPWQTFCWTLLCEWIRPVCVKNWLREEQRSANWTWSKDQFLRSACLILSIKPWNCERSTSDQLTLLAIRQLSFSISSVAYQSFETPVKITSTILYILESRSLSWPYSWDWPIQLQFYKWTYAHWIMCRGNLLCETGRKGIISLHFTSERNWTRRGGMT